MQRRRGARKRCVKISRCWCLSALTANSHLLYIVPYLLLRTSRSFVISVCTNCQSQAFVSHDKLSLAVKDCEFDRLSSTQFAMTRMFTLRRSWIQPVNLPKVVAVYNLDCHSEVPHQVRKTTFIQCYALNSGSENEIKADFFAYFCSHIKPYFGRTSSAKLRNAKNSKIAIGVVL